jgi:hypothetical protein
MDNIERLRATDEITQLKARRVHSHRKSVLRRWRRHRAFQPLRTLGRIKSH